MAAIFEFIRFIFRNTDKSLELCTDKNYDDMLRKFFQRNLSAAFAGILLMNMSACEVLDDDIEKHGGVDSTMHVELELVARILSEVQLDMGHLTEVREAVMASSFNGYDEEYTMRDLFEDPGKGVGDERLSTRGTSRSSYDNPLRDVISRHVRSSVATKASVAAGSLPVSRSSSTTMSASATTFDPDEFLAALSSSDIQIYWPFADSWDGSRMPVITFDPEDGSDVNMGFRLVINDDGSRSVEEIVVDEELAKSEPVWVVNRNSDAEFTTLELLRREDPNWGEGGGTIIVKPQTRSEAALSEHTKTGQSKSLQTRTGLSGTGTTGAKSLVLKDFTMQRHYDTWFAGASEFFVKVGSVDDFTAATEAELRMYNPLITDFMVVVKRNQLGKSQKSDILLVSDWNPQMTHCAFMITEDDGGTRTEWKCTALVRIKSMSYGVELNLPFNTRDDIVWRGQLSQRWLESNSGYSGSFGDLDLTFEVVEY